MAAYSRSRGHKIKYDGSQWVYNDTGKPLDDSRACRRCNRQPTLEGYDACLGKLYNVVSACCGHGVEKAYIST